jgi:TolB-like protein/Flp pilus assembly protein TadD
MGKNVRQLAAVMFTDMVGYTALMQEDEQKARNNRDRHREVLERLIRENQGSILQYFGDGTLSVFDSAIKAVKCALEIQKELQREPAIPVRIGLHVGDIVYEEDGVYGDAVNVAARIEAISIPGAVLFSDKVFDDIKNHPQFHADSLGEFKFKNVKRPVEVFALSDRQLTVPTAKDLEGKVPPAIKRVAVLPFVNMSSDPENEYFSEGISEELINAFTKVDGLEVTARTSSFAFKGKKLDIREIGTKLDVDTILEGSVRKAGNRVRITAQLVNTANGYHLFSETYDRGLEDIFEVQDEIAGKITRKLTSRMDGSKIKKSLVKSLTGNLDAYNVYLKGIFYWNKWTPDNMKKAIELFEKALEMEPDFAAVYSWLSYCYIVLGAMGNLLPQIAYPKAKEFAHKALELDDELYDSHLSIALVKIFYEWDCDEAYKSVKRALELNPGAGRVHHIYAMYLQTGGRMEEAVKEMELAARLDPLDLPINNHLANVYFSAERYDDALRQLDGILEIDSTYRAAIELKGVSLLMKGEIEKAIETFERNQTLTGTYARGVTALGYAYAKAGRLEDAQNCLRKLEKRQQQEKQELLSMDFVIFYIGLGDFDKAYYHLEKAVEARLGDIIFMRSNPVYKEFRLDPRYKALMKKIGLEAKCQLSTDQCHLG